MPLPLEAVPNFSEGRDPAVVKAIGDALAEHGELLDVHSDPDHNRSVFTLVANDREYMGAHTNGRLANLLGFAYLILILVIALSAVPLLLITNVGQN